MSNKQATKQVLHEKDNLKLQDLYFRLLAIFERGKPPRFIDEQSELKHYREIIEEINVLYHDGQ